MLQGLDTQVNLITGAKYPEYTVSSTPASYYLDITILAQQIQIYIH